MTYSSNKILVSMMMIFISVLNNAMAELPAKLISVTPDYKIYAIQLPGYPDYYQVKRSGDVTQIGIEWRTPNGDKYMATGFGEAKCKSGLMRLISYQVKGMVDTEFIKPAAGSVGDSVMKFICN